MNEPETFVIVILGLAAFVRGAFGFADALVAMPLLLMLLPTTEAASLMSMVACLIAVVILCRERQAVEFRSAATLIVFGIIGVPMGIWLAGVVDQKIARTILGGVVVGFSGWSLLKPEQLHIASDRPAPAFGLAAGILGGAFNTAGPPIVFFAALRRWPPSRFRATMQAYTLFGSSWVIAMHSIAGNITQATLTRLAIAAPLVVVATLFGQRFTAKLATERFIKWIYRLLIVLGIFLMVSGLM